MDPDIARMRVEYDVGAGLRAADAGADPMGLFAMWFDAAGAHPQVAERNAMALATTTPDGVPSVRMVLLKGVDPAAASFTWYTNLDSRKAREAMSGARRAALVWWWPGDGGRQVRAAGPVRHVPAAEADAYFEGRPRAARIGAAASHQSRAVASRAVIEGRAASLLEDAADGAIDRPAGWGGLCVVADELEFWHGRAGRLHDRIAFLRTDPDGRPCSTAAIESAGGLDQVLAEAVAVTDPHGTAWLRLRLEP